MKKVFAVFLVFVLALPVLSGCSSEISLLPESAGAETTAPAGTETAVTLPARSVLHPMSGRPSYVLHEGATADEMRAMAVKAMRDELSIVWYPERELVYEFRGHTGETKSFRLPVSATYAGLPYTNGASGLFQFLEYYDPATGRVFGPTGEDFNTLLGNQCSASVIWALSAVASSMIFHTSGMRRAEGYFPVGDYDLPDVSVSSVEVCQDNGRETKYAAYALLRPADCITGDDHAVMAIEPAVVVKNADGSINGAESYVIIQDQRGNQRHEEVETTEDGERVRRAGRLSARLSFEYLFDGAYLPITCAEFMGAKPYVLPAVSPDRAIASFEDLAAATLSSEYNLCVFYYDLLGADGKSLYSRSVVTDYDDLKALKLKSYPLADLRLSAKSLSRAAGLKGDYTFVLSCLDATGSTFECARFEITI